MVQHKLSIHHAHSRHHLFVAMAIVALLGLLGFVVADLAKSFLGPRQHTPFAENHEVTYRHQALYSGPALSSQQSAYSGIGMSASTLPASTMGRVTSSRAMATPTVASVSSSTSMVLHTGSSQSLNSYGGGTSASGYSTGGAVSSPSISSVTATASVVPSVSYAAISHSAKSTPSVAESTSIQSGPRRAYGPGATTDGAGNYYDEEEEEWLPIPGAGSYIGQTKVEDGTEYYWNGSNWVKTATDVQGEPVGDVPMTCLFLMIFAYISFIAYRKKRLQ